MRNIRIIEHISLDAVIQAPGGPEEDTNGFAYGGWAGPYVPTRKQVRTSSRLTARLSICCWGRRTDDIWSGFWPKAPKSPMADSFNGATKYVATDRPRMDRPRTLERTSLRAFAASRRRAGRS